MGFNPFREKGISIEDQFKPWPKINVKPYDSASVHPYTRTRGILMNGIEVESVFFYHQFHRHTDNMGLRRKLALIRRMEQQQQKEINWSIPAQESTLEVTIGFEQLAVDLTAAMAKTEPDPYVKSALDYALIEDFDHLYRYANLMLITEGKKAESIVKDLTEVMPGRPTVFEHLHPFDTVRNFYDRTTADPLTKLHVATIIAAEQQTMNFYMNVGNRAPDTMGRGLYQEIAQIEEEHVSHYGSLQDPRASWFEMAVLHEYNECYMYWSCMQSETDARMRSVWERHLGEEIEHLHMVADLMKSYEKTDPQEQHPDAFPQALVLESSKDYVREVLANQMHYTSDGTKFVPLADAENFDRFDSLLKKVNSGEYVPSQKVVLNAIDANKHDYRVETEGENPIDLLQSPTEVPNLDELVEYALARDVE